MIKSSYIVSSYGKDSSGDQSFLLVEYTLDGALNDDPTTGFGTGHSGYIATHVGSRECPLSVLYASM